MSTDSKSVAKRIPKKEKWTDIISKSNIDIAKPVNYITARQVKQISNEEPRLMAKMDRLEDVPKIFKDNGLFIYLSAEVNMQLSKEKDSINLNQ